MGVLSNDSSKLDLEPIALQPFSFLPKCWCLFLLMITAVISGAIGVRIPIPLLKPWTPWNRILYSRACSKLPWPSTQEVDLPRFAGRLDLLVVCVEAGLGLDQHFEKLPKKMKKSYRVLADEIGLSNLHMQMVVRRTSSPGVGTKDRCRRFAFPGVALDPSR